MNNQQQNPWEAQMQNLAYKKAYMDNQLQYNLTDGFNQMTNEMGRVKMGSGDSRDIMGLQAWNNKMSATMSMMGHPYLPIGGGGGGGGKGGTVNAASVPEISQAEETARREAAIASAETQKNLDMLRLQQTAAFGGQQSYARNSSSSPPPSTNVWYPSTQRMTPPKKWSKPD